MSRQITDQMGIEREIPDNPQRLISLVPSQTAYLAELECDKEVVGITKFCVEPEKWFRNKERIGGTKQLKHDKIASLEPDLIIGNKEENTEDDILKLTETPVWMSDITTLGDALQMMATIGEIMNKEEKAEEIVDKIHSYRNDFRSIISKARPSVAYLIWRKPFMVAGGNTFINKMLEEAGFQNVFADSDSNNERYPTVNIPEVCEKKPDYVFLSSEPFPFKEKHKKEWSDFIEIDRIKVVDAVPFSWYGSHLLESYAYFSKLREEMKL